MRDRKHIAFLSTYPPRECGLATFTQDLVNSLDAVSPVLKTSIVAVSDKPYRYDNRVILELRQHDRPSYQDVAAQINRMSVDLLVLEHEYGIFGGECGEYLLDLIATLEIPFVTTVHTVLLHPSPKQRAILERLGQESRAVITMAHNSVPVLKEVYGIPAAKIRVIPHGVPYRELESREVLKAKAGLEGRTIISTFGLINPGKGLEYGIQAVASVAQTHPEVLYLILGQTHPGVKRESGENYRESLERLVDELQVHPNVRFVNRYLTQEEIITYLQLSDIYMTPYLNPEQAVSGTLAYAVGYGRVTVSTPYRYAQDMLGDGRGMLAKFRDAQSLAECINYLLEHPGEKAAMEERCLQLGKRMMWPQVAREYEQLFLTAIDNMSRKEEEMPA